MIVLPGDIPTTVDLPVIVYSYLIERGGRSEYVKNVQSRFLQRTTRLQIIFARKFFDFLLNFDVPVVAIPGNVETPEFREWIKTYSEIKPNLIWLQEKSIMIDDLQLLGFGWVTDSSGEKRAKSFGEIHPLTAYRKLSGLGKQIRDDANTRILISHSPPYGTSLDYIPSKKIHAGSKPISYFMENAGIEGVICGHIHESRGLYYSPNGWWGLNPGATVEDSACIIDLENRRIKWLRNIVSNASPLSFLYRYRQRLRYNSGLFHRNFPSNDLPTINPKTYHRG